MRSALSSPPFHPPSECNLEVIIKTIDIRVHVWLYILLISYMYEYSSYLYPICINIHPTDIPLHQSNRFNPRGWPKRSQVHLLCKECLVPCAHGNFMICIHYWTHFTITIHWSSSTSAAIFQRRLRPMVPCGRWTVPRLGKSFSRAPSKSEKCTSPSSKMSPSWNILRWLIL